MDVVELLARSFARQISKDGAVALTSSNHPALVAAFAHLGWSDPYIDPTLLPPVVPAPKIDVTDLTGRAESVKAAAPQGRQ